MQEGSSDCVGSILGNDLGFGSQETVWLLGDSFMKNVYTVFSTDPSSNTSTVGFATLSDSASA